MTVAALHVTYSDDAQGLTDLITENEDGVSVMTYMRSLYPLDWQNFLVRPHTRTHERLWLVCVLQTPGNEDHGSTVRHAGWSPRVLEPNTLALGHGFSNVMRWCAPTWDNSTT